MMDPITQIAAMNGWMREQREKKQPPRPGPTMDAWRAQIPQDIEQPEHVQQRRPWYEMPSRDELVDMAANMVTPLAGTIGKVAGKGVQAWHGSPAKGITKFDSRKIGSGEGIQNYGHGHYFSAERPVGEWYKNTLARDDGGALYKVNLDIDPDRVLHFEKPLEAHPAGVLEAVSSAFQAVKRSPLSSKTNKELERIIQRIDPNGEWVGSGLSRDDLLMAAEEMGVDDYLNSPITPDRDGRSVYEQLTSLLGGGGKSRGGGQAQASKALGRSGIHGLGHLETQAKSGAGAQNYVVFDPKRIKILEALGLAGIFGGGYKAMQPAAPKERRGIQPL